MCVTPRSLPSSKGLSMEPRGQDLGTRHVSFDLLSSDRAPPDGVIHGPNESPRSHAVGVEFELVSDPPHEIFDGNDFDVVLGKKASE